MCCNSASQRGVRDQVCRIRLQALAVYLSVQIVLLMFASVTRGSIAPGAQAGSGRSDLCQRCSCG